MPAKNGGSSRLGGQTSNLCGPPFFFKCLSFLSSFSSKIQLLLLMASTLLPTHKFEIIITNSLKFFYTLMQNLNKNVQKGTRKKNFGCKS